MKIITGKGIVLRELVSLIKNEKDFNLKDFFQIDNCLFFPETELDIHEQAEFLSLLLTDKVIFTFSSWIISDSKQEEVFTVHKEENKFYLEQTNFNTFGASVNKINFNLFKKRETISNKSYNRINELNKDLDNNILFDFNNIDYELGESVEKTLLFKVFFEKEKNNKR